MTEKGPLQYFASAFLKLGPLTQICWTINPIDAGQHGLLLAIHGAVQWVQCVCGVERNSLSFKIDLNVTRAE